jgi:hypothetical protein
VKPPSPWLRGPIEGVPMALQPAAHALMASAEEVVDATRELTVPELWEMPHGAASVGFHLRHIAGSIDRLLTYGRGEQLDEEGRRAMALEKLPGSPAADAQHLLASVLAAIERALDTYRRTPVQSLGEPRAVGTARLMSTVHGVLAHIGDHTQRHAGQVVTTAKIVHAIALGGREDGEA